MSEIVSVAEVKQYIKEDSDDTAVEITIKGMIDTAEALLIGMTGKTFDSSNAMAISFIKMLVAMYYDNRGNIEVVSDSTQLPLGAKLIVMQLSYGSDET